MDVAEGDFGFARVGGAAGVHAAEGQRCGSYAEVGALLRPNASAPCFRRPTGASTFNTPYIFCALTAWK